jgi:hypothetical protein
LIGFFGNRARSGNLKFNKSTINKSILLNDAFGSPNAAPKRRSMSVKAGDTLPFDVKLKEMGEK